MRLSLRSVFKNVKNKCTQESAIGGQGSLTEPL